jgi:hypothetical protein
VRAPIVVNTDVAARPKIVPKRYGKPYIVMEDDRKQTFIFDGGSWVAYSRSIAQCRADQCQVKPLAQRVNNMLRYEVSDLV